MINKRLAILGAIALAIAGLYLLNNQANNLADVLPTDPAYADGSAIDQSLTSADGTVDQSIDQDLTDNDSDSSTF